MRSRTDHGFSIEDVSHFRARMLQELMANALAEQWLRRAHEFDGCGRPDVAAACRARASLAFPPMPVEDIAAVLDEYDENCPTRGAVAPVATTYGRGQFGEVGADVA